LRKSQTAHGSANPDHPATVAARSEFQRAVQEEGRGRQQAALAEMQLARIDAAKGGLAGWMGRRRKLGSDEAAGAGRPLRMMDANGQSVLTEDQTVEAAVALRQKSGQTRPFYDTESMAVAEGNCGTVHERKIAEWRMGIHRYPAADSEGGIQARHRPVLEDVEGRPGAVLDATSEEESCATSSSDGSDAGDAGDAEVSLPAMTGAVPGSLLLRAQRRLKEAKASIRIPFAAAKRAALSGISGVGGLLVALFSLLFVAQAAAWSCAIGSSTSYTRGS